MLAFHSLLTLQRQESIGKKIGRHLQSLVIAAVAGSVSVAITNPVYGGCLYPQATAPQQYYKDADRFWLLTKGQATVLIMGTSPMDAPQNVINFTVTMTLHGKNRTVCSNQNGLEVGFNWAKCTVSINDADLDGDDAVRVDVNLLNNSSNSTIRYVMVCYDDDKTHNFLASSARKNLKIKNAK